MTNILRRKIPNEYRLEYVEGVECVVFTTEGKHQHDVIVDKSSWFGYLCNYKWNATKNTSRIEVRTSIKGVSTKLYRMIAEHEFGEFLIYNRDIDHKNNNHFDNRSVNLRPVCQLLNSSNRVSKRNYIYPQNDVNFIVMMNISGERYHKTFWNLEEAEKYRDEVLIPLRESEMNALEKKDRDIEFERGLMLKIENGEMDEVIDTLRKYNLIVNKF